MDEVLPTLIKLGLTLVQAKVYIALTSSDALTIQKLSDVSGVARTDLYRVMKELQNEGVVEKILVNPTQFKATPMDQVLNHLIQKRNKESLEIKKKTLALKRELKKKPQNNTTKLVPKFILIPSKRAPDRIGEAIDNANKSINLAVSWSRFSRGLNFFTDKLKKSWTKKVKWRIILEMPPDTNHSLDHIQFCRKNSSCEVRFIPPPIKTITGIYDQKELFIIENPAVGISNSPALWTNNKSLLSLAKDYFDILWIISLKEPKYYTDNKGDRVFEVK